MEEINAIKESFWEKTITRDSAQQGALSGAALACSGIKDSAIIVHGSPGCGWAARWMRSEHALTNYIPVIATSLLEDEFIFGGSEKLRNTIKWAVEKWKPKYLFILNGDTGSLISDPVEDIVVEFERIYHIPIIPLDIPFFAGLEATGVDNVLATILRRFGKDEGKDEEDSVNLIAPFLMGSNNWVYDLEEIKNLLKSIDISVNCILTYNTNMKEIEGFNRARADLYLTYETLPQLGKYEDEHGLKRIGQDLPLPIGIANTEEWYLKIAEQFGKREKAEEVLKEERTILKDLKLLYNFTWLQTWLSNKYAAVVGPAPWAASFANFLYYDLTVFPSVIALYGETEECMDRAKEILKDLRSYYDPIVLENPLYIQLMDAVESRGVEFAIGQTQEKSLFEGNNIAHLSLAGLFSIFGAFNFIPYPSMGFKGIFYLLTMLGRLVEQAFHEPQRWKDLRYQRQK